LRGAARARSTVPQSRAWPLPVRGNGNHLELIAGQHIACLNRVAPALVQLALAHAGQLVDGRKKHLLDLGELGISAREPLWGAPRIHGELLKLGTDIGETSVSKYLKRCHKPPSQIWRTFLDNHVKSMVSVDFFTVPTIRFQILYVFLILAHDRLRILHFGVTACPTAEWTAQQLREAFPWETATRYLLRDRDRIFGADFVQ
jgi:hypothetical protein